MKYMRFGAGAVLGAACLGLRTAAAQAPADEAALEAAAKAVETATRDVKSIAAPYRMESAVFGRMEKRVEEGNFYWKRTPEGKIFARWEGRAEKESVLTLVRDQELSVWINQKFVSKTKLDDPVLHHPSKFCFPVLPPNRAAKYELRPPWASPEFDDRWSKQIGPGVPHLLGLSPKEPNERFTFRLVSFVFDIQSGLAYRYRCDTHGWQHIEVTLEPWKLNEELPDALFAPPGPMTPRPAPPANAGARGGGK